MAVNVIQSIVLLVINIVFILLGGYAFSVLESREDKNVSIIYKLYTAKLNKELKLPGSVQAHLYTHVNMFICKPLDLYKSINTEQQMLYNMVYCIFNFLIYKHSINTWSSQ